MQALDMAILNLESWEGNKMGKRRVEELIIPALNAIESNMFKGEKDYSKCEVPAEFKGYISSFGASIIQNGLVSTIHFFNNKNANTKEDRTIIITLLFDMLKSYYIQNNTYEFNFENINSLLELVKENNNRLDILTEIIIDAAIALKLAIRTYKISDKKKKEEGNG